MIPSPLYQQAKNDNVTPTSATLKLMLSPLQQAHYKLHRHPYMSHTTSETVTPTSATLQLIPSRLHQPQPKW